MIGPGPQIPPDFAWNITAYIEQASAFERQISPILRSSVREIGRRGDLNHLPDAFSDRCLK